MSTDPSETPVSPETTDDAKDTSPTTVPADINAAPADIFALPERARQIRPGFGWTTYAEIMNGRFAMIGFVALLVIEIVTHKDFFTWLGLR